MRVFVFTYDRFDSITTSAILESSGIDHIVLCHTEEQRAAFIAAGRVKSERLVVTGKPKGLAYNRNVALEMMSQDEWSVFLVDDLKKITMLRNYDTAPDPLPITTKNQRAYAKRFQHEITIAELLERADGLVHRCERIGARLGGWAGIDNPLFRRGHWGHNVLADGRAWVVRKSSLRFDEQVQMVDDVCWTALNIREFGHVVVDRWILPDCARYTAGSFGSIDQRMEQKLRECAHLVATYPDLVRFAPKAGWPTGSHVVLR